MIENQKKENPFFRILEFVAVCVVLHYLVSCFLGFTRFKFNYDETFSTITFSITVVVGMTRLMAVYWMEARKAGDGKEGRTILLKGIACVLFSVPCIYLAQKFQYGSFIYLPFVAYCLYHTNANRILKCYIICISMLLAVTILCSLSGSIENLLYLGWGRKGAVRGSYGAPYPTDCAAYFFFLFLFFWIIQRKHGWIVTLLMICLAAVMAYGTNTFMISRNSTICLLATAVMVLYDKLYDTVLSRQKGTKWITKTVDFLVTYAFPILAAVIIGMTWLYGTGSDLGMRLNTLLSERLQQMWDSFQKYGIQAMGALTPQSGWGGIQIKTREYEFLDSSYALLLIRYGWILTLIMGFIWVWMTRKALKSGNRKLALGMGVVALYSLIEHHFPEPNFNMLVVMPLCLFVRNEKPEEQSVTDKKTKGSLVSAATVVFLFALLLPGMISWSRFLFKQWGWTGGGDPSFYAFLAWLCCLAVFAGIWFALRCVLTGASDKKGFNWKAFSGLVVLACVLAGFGFWINGQISKGMPEYEAQISADRDAVSFVLENAKEPVYAGQAEGEVYHRSFRGISDWILSPEEMARKGYGKGSILLEHDNEAHQLIVDGAKYAELSPYTGIFTYDDGLAEKLNEAGYIIYDHYAAEREEDLPFFLNRNEVFLNDDGTLKLGPGIEKSIIHGVFMNQYKGNYRVVYSLELVDPELRTASPDQKICILRAAAMYGQDVRHQIDIYAKDFDENGRLVAELDYAVEDTIGVEHLVYCSSGIELIVKRIAWKQI